MCVCIPFYSPLLKELTKKAMEENEEMGQSLDSLSPEDKQYLENLRRNVPQRIDKGFIEEFSQRLMKYPKEIKTFVAIFATLLQANRDLHAENDELARAISQIREEINELMRR